MKTPPMKVTIGEMTDQALICRSLRSHKYDDGSDEDFKMQRGRLVSVERHHYCERCRASKVQVIDGETGVVIETKDRHYEPGYLSSQGRLTTADARVEQFKRRGYTKR